jgi:hypothetical protein
VEAHIPTEAEIAAARAVKLAEPRRKPEPPTRTVWVREGPAEWPPRKDTPVAPGDGLAAAVDRVARAADGLAAAHRDRPK